MTVCDNQTPIICVLLTQLIDRNYIDFAAHSFVTRKTQFVNDWWETVVLPIRPTSFICVNFPHQELKLHVNSEGLDLKGVMPG